MKSTIKAMMVMSVGGILVACGGGGSSSSSSGSTVTQGEVVTTYSKVITISPSLGQITNATVKIYDANYSKVIGKGALGENGKASIVVDYGIKGPTIVEVIAGDNSTYFDEHAGLVPLAKGTKLHAINKDSSSTAVTPLTELAWQLALSQGNFPLDRERAVNLNHAVSQLFTGGALDINYPPSILSEMPAASSQADTRANLYAAILGAIAKLGDTEAAPALAILSELSGDAVDGVLNNSDGDSLYSNFGAEFRLKLDEWAENYGTKEAREAIFALPLAGFTLNYRANISAPDRLANMEYGVGSEVAASRDANVGGGEWALFPEGSMVSFHREGSIIGVAAGDNSLDPDAGEFITGWSVDIQTADYESFFENPRINGIRVEVPTGDPDLVRYMMFVTRDGLDMDDLILIEDDRTTFGATSDRVAHLLTYDAFDFMQPEVQSFFNDVDAMAINGDALTVIKSMSSSRECGPAFIGSNNSNRYPKLIGLVYDEFNQDVVSLEPQQMRYAESGDQREILFAGRTLFRLNDQSGRVDHIAYDSVGGIVQWATNDVGMIADYCPE